MSLPWKCNPHQKVSCPWAGGVCSSLLLIYICTFPCEMWGWWRFFLSDIPHIPKSIKITPWSPHLGPASTKMDSWSVAVEVTWTFVLLLHLLQSREGKLSSFIHKYPSLHIIYEVLGGLFGMCIWLAIGKCVVFGFLWVQQHHYLPCQALLPELHMWGSGITWAV